MRVIQNELPQERKTVVELTDRDIQFLEGGLFRDRTNNDENTDLWIDFQQLRTDLRLTKLR